MFRRHLGMCFKALACSCALQDRSPREWKCPQLRLDGNELPLGIGIIAALFFSVAGINLLTKQVATVSVWSSHWSFSQSSLL